MKYRLIDTRFWSDSYVSDLDPSEKLLFVYLFTNSKTDLCGAYELPIKFMAAETGIEKEMVEKILSRFERDGKIIRDSGWIHIVNFAKHQSWNPSMKEGAKKSKELLPLNLQKKIQAVTACDSLPQAVQISESESESKLKSELESESELKATPVGGAETAPDPVNQVFDVFYETINPHISYGRGPWRTAASDLIREFGLEETISLSRLACKVSGLPDQYAPVITNPYQLKEKLAQLQIYVNKQSLPKKGAIQTL